ncbi:TraB/GumN family protein [Micavibrio aeruginosavorus]|uniref:GumN family protein n=1 Tax=Micavibrio aeruginosavorus (strain ARL-13) TaxID=856793 RepID=G2KS24_MICAA|nr:TraB/GumN family protein [Micavibrio aeruginosavorus]AEP10532.1 gumN family protein [Micavibrio aeruginosavorus ARL-13]
MRGFKIACLSAALCALITSGAAHAKDPAEHLYKPDPAYPPQPAMFVLRDQDSTIYMFGSAHKIEKHMKWRTPLFNEALAKSDTLWLESTYTNMLDPSLRREQALSSFDTGTSLSRRLTPEQREKMEKLMAESGLQWTDLDRMKPWLAADALSAEFYGAKMQNNHKETDKTQKYKRRKITGGVEYILETSALGIPRKAIEPIRDHYLLFSNLPDADQMDYLTYTVDRLLEETAEKSDHKIDSLQKAWLNGDLPTQDELANGDMRRKMPGLYSAMMPERNIRITDAIIRELNGSGDDFIVIGSAHFAGPDSVLRMLIERGYTPERVYDTNEPETSFSNKSFYPPLYGEGKIMPKAVTMSLLPSKTNRVDEVVVRLTTPVAYHFCGRVSPMLHMIIPEQDSMTIYTGPYYITQYPKEKQDDCGSPTKTSTLDIPLALDQLVGDKPRILQFWAAGRMDSFKVSLVDNTLTFEPMGPNLYFKPVTKHQLTLDLASLGQ